MYHSHVLRRSAQLCCRHEGIEHERKPRSEEDLIAPHSTATLQSGRCHADCENEEADEADHDQDADLLETITDDGRGWANKRVA